MKNVIIILVALISNVSLAQSKDSISSKAYYEDQFYIGATYNSIYKIPIFKI